MEQPPRGAVPVEQPRVVRPPVERHWPKKKQRCIEVKRGSVTGLDVHRRGLSVRDALQ